MESLALMIEAANQELIGTGNYDAVPRFFSPGYVAHLTDQDTVGGHRQIRAFLEMYRRAFPTISVQVEILVEGTDRVAWQRILRGKQEGAFKGFPATDREVVWRDVVTSRFHEGLIAEEWVISDLAERLLLSRKKGLGAAT